MPASLEGSCYCGQVRFLVDPPSRFVEHCHCLNCQKAHGAGFVTWAGFPEEQFRFSAGEELLSRFHTETKAVRSFCSVCGTTMFYATDRWPGEIHIAVACLDGGPDKLPTGHVYADRSPDWCPIVDALPRHGGESGMEAL